MYLISLASRSSCHSLRCCCHQLSFSSAMTMFPRRRKHRQPKSYSLDAFSESRAVSTQWESGGEPGTGLGGIASTIPIPDPTMSAGLQSILHQPRPKRPITRALLNKPLPPLPLEAFADMPPEKPPVKPVPDLAQHPALRAQTIATSSRNPGFNSSSRHAEHVKEPSGVVLDTPRHSSSSSELRWTSRRSGMTVPQTKQKNPNMSEDTTEIREKPEMIDRGTQTTPSLASRNHAPIVSPAANLPSATPATIRPMNSKARIWRGSSSEDVQGPRTPLWSPRTIIRQSSGYFSSWHAENDADTEDNVVELHFRKYLGRLKSATPPSPFGRKGATTAASRSSCNEADLASQPQAAARPGILRNANSEDRSSTPRKAVSYEEVAVRPHLRDLNSAPAVLRTSSGKTPGSPATRPLPLPLQKLTSFSHGPLIRRRMSSYHSDSSNSTAASPLRQELRRHSLSPPTLIGIAQGAPQVAAPANFKINRPRAVKIPSSPRNQAFAGSNGPVTTQEVDEAASLFFARTAYLVDQPDEFGNRVRAEQNVPEHLAGSPLCPMSPKHKSGGWGVCPYHGRRKSTTDSTTNDDRRPSDNSNKSIPSSRHESPCRSSIIPSEPSEPAEARRVSLESQSEYYHHRRSALDDTGDDRKRLGEDYNYTDRPKLGRQTSWGAATDDGAVRGFGFSPSPPRSAPRTPATPVKTGLSRERSVIYNTVIKHLQIHDDDTDGLAHTPYKHEEQRLASAKHSPYPSPQATEEPPTPPSPPQEESRATRNASFRRGRTMAVKPGVIARGDRVAVFTDSTDSVYRLGGSYRGSDL